MIIFKIATIRIFKASLSTAPIPTSTTSNFYFCFFSIDSFLRYKLSALNNGCIANKVFLDFRSIRMYKYSK